MSGEFRDRIEEVVDSYTYAMATQAAITPSSADIADAILAMPEMEAIRGFIRDAADHAVFTGMEKHQSDYMVVMGMYTSVIDWVLSGLNKEEVNTDG